LLWLGGLGWVLREVCFSVWREGMERDFV
jgi:hypothetical protein